MLLANLLFFAWTQGYFGAVGAGHEPQRLASQLAPERLHIIGIGQPAPVTGPVTAVAGPPPESCRLVGGLSKDEAQRLRTDTKLTGLRLAVKTSNNSSTYLVLIPSLANRLAADKKLAELKQLGLSGFYVMLEEGAYKFAISLGQFDTEAAAVEFLQGLAKRGVKSAKLQVLDKPADQVQLEVRGPADLLDKQLPPLFAGKTSAAISDCPVAP